jgi:hypothetical protein
MSACSRKVAQGRNHNAGFAARSALEGALPKSARLEILLCDLLAWSGGKNILRRPFQWSYHFDEKHVCK